MASLGKSDSSFVRVHVFFSGHVQGVGFRYTVSSLAPAYEVVGWVRNLVDGRVEMIAEGERVKVDQWVEEIQNVMGSFVRETDVSWSESMGRFNGFSIRH